MTTCLCERGTFMWSMFVSLSITWATIWDLGKCLGYLCTDMKGRVLAAKMVINEFRTVNGVFK